MCRREKNWGFWEQDGKLLILYGTLPCTVVLEFDPLQSMEPTIRSRRCQVPQASSILQTAGRSRTSLLHTPAHLHALDGMVETPEGVANSRSPTLWPTLLLR